MLIQNEYRITCFVPDIFGVDGRIMVLADCPSNMQPLRSLLMHHFRNSVLCNMKGRGSEYEWDGFITPGVDPVAEISNSAHGKLRFEMEIAQQLNYLDS